MSSPSPKPYDSGWSSDAESNANDQRALNKSSNFLAVPRELGLLAVGFGHGQGKSGVDLGPAAMLEAGLLKQLQDDLEYDVHFDNRMSNYDDGFDHDADRQNMKHAHVTSIATEQISSQVYKHSAQGRFVLTLGGDHSIAIGTVSGTARACKERLGREMAVIWVDAHADINTPETSGTGNIHGMPLAFLTGLVKARGKGEPFGWMYGEQDDDGKGLISMQKLVYIGLRDVDREEKRLLRSCGVKAFSMHHVDRYGIGKVMEMAIAWIGRDTPIHLSFDIDSLDPMCAPSTGTAVRGGLTLREGDFIAEYVHGTGNLIAMDLVEVNPSLEPYGAAATVAAAISIVRCALGDSLL